MSREGNWAVAQFESGYHGYAVELGATDGLFLSNTKVLEDNGWTVLCIEPNPMHHEALSRTRKLCLRCACDREPRVRAELEVMGNQPPYSHAVLRYTNGPPAEAQFGRSHKVLTTVLTLDQCLTVCGFPLLDVLSLDVDGIERDILAGLDLARWKPKVVIIEEHRERALSDALPGYRYAQRIGDNGCYLRTAP